MFRRKSVSWRKQWFRRAKLARVPCFSREAPAHFRSSSARSRQQDARAAGNEGISEQDTIGEPSSERLAVPDRRSIAQLRHASNSMQQAHCPQRQKASQATSPIMKPVDDRSSHMRTMTEFFAVNKDEAENANEGKEKLHYREKLLENVSDEVVNGFNVGEGHIRPWRDQKRADLKLV
jgi:hypothetical protein